MPRKKRKIAVIDAETDPFKHGRTPRPFAWGYYDGTYYQYFWGDDATDQLIEFLSTEEPTIVYAHNGGKFDYFYLLQWLCPEVFIINGRISRAFLFDMSIELRDSWLILPLALASHDKNDIEYWKLERHCRETHKQEILEYLRKDCTSLYEWVTQYIETFGNNLTLAGTAFKELRASGYDITNTYLDFDDQLRRFYYGGRVQCFEVGSFFEPFNVVDINSAYPEAMLHNHWYGSQYVETFRFPSTDNGSWFADIDAVSRGALPYRHDEKLYFPDDNQTRNYTASGWEINAAIKNNALRVKKINRVYRPVLTENFTTYVNKFFTMKADADLSMKKAKEKGDTIEALYWSAQRQFAKLLLNSAYGKFGQDGRDFKEFHLCDFGEFPPQEEEKPRWLPYVDLEPVNKSIFNRPAPVEKFYNVATAASITGYVRAKLFDALCNSERPLYCDTDSIICRDTTVPISDKLGDWEIEAALKEIHIAQRKLYAGITEEGKYKLATKGVNIGKRSDDLVQRKLYNLIKEGIKTGEAYSYKMDSPAFNLKLGAIIPRFFDRTINFQNIYNNTCANPDDLVELMTH